MVSGEMHLPGDIAGRDIKREKLHFNEIMCCHIGRVLTREL